MLHHHMEDMGETDSDSSAIDHHHLCMLSWHPPPSPPPLLASSHWSPCSQLHVCPIKRDVRYYRLYASKYGGSNARSAMTVTVREEH